METSEQSESEEREISLISTFMMNSTEQKKSSNNKGKTHESKSEDDSFEYEDPEEIRRKARAHLLASSGAVTLLHRVEKKVDEFDEFEVDESYDREVQEAFLAYDLAVLKSQNYIGCYYCDPTEIVIYVGLSMSFLSDDLASGCGIDKSKILYCRISFSNPTFYLSKCPTCQSGCLIVGQSDETYPKKKADESAFIKPGIWWPLEQKLTEHFKSNWETIKSNGEVSARKSLELDTKVKNLRDILDTPREHNFVLLVASQKFSNEDEAVSCLVDEEQFSLLEAEAKVMISKYSEAIDCNFMIYLAKLLKQYVEESANTCPICFRVHPITFTKSMVCDNPLCKYQFISLGLGASIETALVHEPETVTLLLTTTIAGCNSRHFEPFPVEVQKLDNEGNVIKFDTAEGGGPVNSVLSLLPSVDELRQLALSGKLKATLDDLHPLLYLLVTWIVNTANCHIHFCKPEERIPGMNTPYQYIIKTTQPEKEKYFYKKKKKHGSFYAFHGSGFENWHSILRNGLKNYSGTKNQTSGAVYGPGIYLGTKATTSYGYAKPFRGWKNSPFEGENFRMMAVCEVINYKGGQIQLCHGKVHQPKCSHNTRSPHIRCEENDFCITRYVFVLGEKHNVATLESSSLKIPSILRFSVRPTGEINKCTTPTACKTCFKEYIPSLDTDIIAMTTAPPPPPQIKVKAKGRNANTAATAAKQEKLYCQMCNKERLTVSPTLHIATTTSATSEKWFKCPMCNRMRCMNCHDKLKLEN